MPDIFDEVDEDLRADHAQRLLRKYGGVLIAGAVAVVLAAAGWQAWQWYQAKQNAGYAAGFLAAMQTADSQKGAGRQAAVPAFAAVADKAPSGYRTLARLREAALKAEGGDLPGADALWDQVAGDGSADAQLRDAANLQWALHNLDSADPAQIASRLQVLSAPSNPYHALAEEAQAMLSLRQGNKDAARDTLKQLSQDATAPEGVRRRADGMLIRLGG